MATHLGPDLVATWRLLHQLNKSLNLSSGIKHHIDSVISDSGWDKESSVSMLKIELSKSQYQTKAKCSYNVSHSQKKSLVLSFKAMCWLGNTYTWKNECNAECRLTGTFFCLIYK